MINNFSLYRLFNILLLVIFFPLVQNQWQNLYLFGQTNFSFYQFLYSLSGAVFPIIVCFNSINIFANYKFSSENINKKFLIDGKFLLFLVLICLLGLSILISNQFFINIDFILQIFFNHTDTLRLDVDKQIMFIFVFSILLTIKKTILIVKRFILTNFFICSLFIWYLQINKSLLDSKFLINNFSNVQNLNIINVCFVFLIELLFYFWSYLSF